MKRRLILSCLIAGFLATGAAHAGSPAATALLEEFRAAGAGPFRAEAGQALWTREFTQKGENRSCTSCHTADLRKSGKHATTGKAIEPMAPSVNPKRLTDRAEMEKWFGRNCKWTLGRLCSPQEKGDLLAYMLAQ